MLFRRSQVRVPKSHSFTLPSSSGKVKVKRHPHKAKKVVLLMIPFLLSLLLFSVLLLRSINNNSIINNNNNSNNVSSFSSNTKVIVGNTSSSSASSSSSSLSPMIKRREGINASWKIVDWNNNPISQQEEERFNCDFVEFTSKWVSKTTQMCVHTFPDTVSDHIRKYQKWDDCYNLPHLWEGRKVDNKGHHNNQSNQNNQNAIPIYVEVGANIGACVLDMLLSTDAHIIAFEPHPMNLYNLKKTILQLDKSYQERLTLYPLGLGDKTDTPTIYSANDNMGNSVIGKIVKDFQGQTFDEKLQFTIHVERLDSLLDSKYMDVKLMKIDAQGYECKVLDGMGSNIIQKVDLIKLEYAYQWLEQHDCLDYLSRIRDYGFDLYLKYPRKAGFQKLDNGNPEGLTKRAHDLMASKPNTNKHFPDKRWFNSADK